MVPIIAVLVTVVLGVGLLLSGLLPFSIQLSTGGASVDGNTVAAAPEPTPLPYYQPPQELHELSGGILYNLEQRIVNLADPGGYRFLRVSIVLEFLPSSPDFYTFSGEKLTAAEDEFRLEIDRQKPLIDNVVTDVLTSKMFDEIFTVEGKIALREQLREQINLQLRNRYVQRVLITDFVIQ
ncbi:MAG: flagellar basal body-associated FliL family protein [Caldilineaceae bacterium]